MRIVLGATAVVIGAAVHLAAQAPTETAQREAREILTEMVSMNTSLQRGDVTPLAEKLAARFRKAGVPAADVQVIGPEARNKNLVVRLRGKGTQKPVLFLAHLDVVDALRGDWSLEPFAVTEKDGWLYGRGTADDKGPATTLVAAALALIRSKVTPDRDIILALTSGEENADLPGAAWLVREHKPMVDADWVFNFDAGGPYIDHGKLAWIELQGAEKVYWSVTLTARNPGGHSSLPRGDNAIFSLVNGVRGLEGLNFPIDLTDVARAQLAAREPFVAASEAVLIRAALKQPLDSDAAFRLARYSPSYNALLRTTCVPTMLAAGHAENALPALAVATVNCRLIPGETPAETMRRLKDAVADTGIAIAEVNPAKPSPASPLLPDRLALVKAAARAAWGHDVPITPVQENGATDGVYFRNAGIPVYGVTGIPMPVGEERMHGKDERIPVKSLRDGVAFATALMAEAAGTRKGKK
ncbi:MAG TPA: M20/M25/M40 family metallo-hydrolase [Gemmatimonadales bacterium]|jgi:acetylornithine deacetylase/succinyl-diaminopimelate desuccinylase-like protein